MQAPVAALTIANSRYLGSRRDNLPTRVTHASPDDDTAVAQTLVEMERIVRASICDPVVTAAAAEATSSTLAPNATRADRAAAVWAYVRDRVRFVLDDEILPGEREALIAPALLLSMDDPRGDCDDFTMCSIALMNAAGVPARAVAIAADSSEPHRFSHVYAEAQLEDGEVLAIDASHGPFAGWCAPNVTRRLAWRFTSAADCATPNNEPPAPLTRHWMIAAAIAGLALLAILGRNR